MLRLRLEQIDAQLPDFQAAIEAQRLAAWEAAWLSHRPALAEAEAQLEAAIRGVYVALEHAHEVHNAAQRNGFGGIRSATSLMLNDWAARQYVATIERRQQAAQPVAPMIELAVISDASASWAQRFTPRKMPRDLVEQISPLAWRHVRVLHTFNASNLNFGRTKLMAGTEMNVPAPAAFAMDRRAERRQGMPHLQLPDLRELVGGYDMPDRINGVPRLSRQAVLASIGVDRIVQQRIASLEQKAALEQQKRIRAEQQAAGYKSACKRLRALLLKAKADDALKVSRVFDAEMAE